MLLSIFWPEGGQKLSMRTTACRLDVQHFPIMFLPGLAGRLQGHGLSKTRLLKLIHVSMCCNLLQFRSSCNKPVATSR